MNALRLAPLAILATLGLTGCGAEYYESGGQTSFAQGGVGYNVEGQNVTEPPPPATTTVIGPDGTAQEVVLGAEEDEYVDTDPTALTEFRTTLDPYGSWVDDGTYGTVWMPSETVVGSDFAPYVSAGHWAYADDYVWVSDYDWGWAPFHYGRWVYITGRGWAWIPGRTYAGAWVSWRVGPAGYGYVGWGPMAPSWYWRGGIAVGLGHYPMTPYTFCSTGDLFHPAIRGRVLAGPQVQTVATNTRPWTPAAPGVGGGGQGGPGRVSATPQVGGPRVGPGGRIFGPPPGTLGLQPQAVAPPPPGEKGLLRAQAFARPSTAVQVGGRAPAGFAGASSRPTPIDYPRAPRDRTVVVQGGPQTYSGPRPMQTPPPSVTQGQGGYHPPPSYSPPPSQGQGQGYRPPPSYTPPPSQGQGQVYRSPPPSYSPPPQVQQRPSSPPPQVQQRPSAPPPQVHQAPPPAPRGGGSIRR